MQDIPVNWLKTKMNEAHDVARRGARRDTNWLQCCVINVFVKLRIHKTIQRQLKNRKECNKPNQLSHYESG
jgi:hypothetical protein